MRKMTQLGLRFGVFLSAAIALILCVGMPSEAADHPRLVNVETAKCGTCHGELVEKPVVHPPVADDCQSCHDFAQAEDSLSVSLMADGAELCVMCHDNLEAAAMGEIEAPHAPVIDDCTNCHDPHSTEYEHLLTVPGSELCASCHDSDEVNDLHSIPVSRSDCRSCHAVHGSDSENMLTGAELHAPFADGACLGCHKKPRGTMIRLVAEGSDLCYACHSDLEGEFSKGFVHGAISRDGCTGCHNPHMAEQAKFLKVPAPELCFSCHPDVQARATGAGAHAAVEDGCNSCHAQHHGEFEFLLVEETPALCLMCHDAEDSDLSEKHLGADLTTTACTSCHDPHGSSQAKLLADVSIHPPFLDDCETCHEGGAQNVMEDGGNDLCYACHTEIEDLVANSTVSHAAMEMAECIDCHSPHASRHERLLLKAGEGTCTTCHDDQAQGEGEYNHDVIDWFGCHSCHLPHGGQKAKLLRQQGNLLCNECHLDALVRADESGAIELRGGLSLAEERARLLKVINLDADQTLNHPIPSHPVAGTITGKSGADIPEALIGEEMSCLSCHDPHVAKSDQLFAYGAATSFELCAACHPK